MRLKGSVAVAQQNADGAALIAVIVDHGQVQLAIPIEVSYGQRECSGACRILHMRLKGSISVAQKYAYGAAPIRSCEVWLTVSVEISYGDRIRKLACREVYSRREGAVDDAH